MSKGRFKAKGKRSQCRAMGCGNVAKYTYRNLNIDGVRSGYQGGVDFTAGHFMIKKQDKAVQA